MEKVFKQQDKEAMKMAMLEQEQTFRQQVQELHRLYRLQRHLMKEMKVEKQGRDQKSRKQGSRRMVDLELPAEAYIQSSDCEGESEVELTLATGSSRGKREEASNLSDSGGSLSSSSAESGSLKLLGHIVWGMSKMPDVYMNAAEGRKRDNVFEGLQEPPWLPPCLSLTMS